MNSKPDSVTLTIDNLTLTVPRGLTILQAARQENIYIPSLCAHEDLSPFGGCRMCIVEVDGMRGFPTACTTAVADGMTVRTRTVQLQEIRSEILQLILSEHPSSCLVCDEKEECKNFTGTIRKAGVTTGCRYCPNDGKCELQKAVEWMGIKEINYPVYYRQLRIEKEDPFYDRDYNLCILCGRCIRMCQEIRMADTLAFKKRGSQTVIGPAYDRSHLEAGCEFCGACVSVCPTGALSEKASKWLGVPDREETTTCPLCGVGCQVDLLVKKDKIVGSIPASDSGVNDGQLCVKGRFCLTELTGHHTRLKAAYRAHGNTTRYLSVDEAVDEAASKLAACPPEKFAMLVSADSPCEDLYIAQKFTRVVMRTHNIDTSARRFYGAAFNAYLALFNMSVPVTSLASAPLILCLGLDTKYARSVIGVALRRAAKSGTRIITINARGHNLSAIAEKWLRPIPGGELGLLQGLQELVKPGGVKHAKSGKKTIAGVTGNDLEEVADLLIRERGHAVFLVGSEFLTQHDASGILEHVRILAEAAGAGVIPLPAQSNLVGSVLMGAYPELLPGGCLSSDHRKLRQFGQQWNVDLMQLSAGRGLCGAMPGDSLEVLYLVGETLSGTSRVADYVIYQNIYPAEPDSKVNLAIPSAAFGEADGTFVNGDKTVFGAHRAVPPPGQALPDWEILCRIARKMGASGFDFENTGAVRTEIAELVHGFSDADSATRYTSNFDWATPFAEPRGSARVSAKSRTQLPYLLNTTIFEHTYRGFPISSYVEGAKRLFSVGELEINPDDAAKAGIGAGEEVIVTGAGFERTWPARIVRDQMPGTLHVTQYCADAMRDNPHPVAIRKKNV